MDGAGREQQSQGKRWWQDWRWVASVAAVMFAGAFGTFVATTLVNNSVIDDLSVLAEANAKSIDRLDRNQEGIDELIAFVHDLQSRPDVEDQTIQTFLDLLCASSDPVRQAACAELTS